MTNDPRPCGLARSAEPAPTRTALPGGRRAFSVAGYSLAGVLRGSRCGLRSGPSLGRFRPGGAGVRRPDSRFRGDAGLSLDRLAMTYSLRPSFGVTGILPRAY